MLNLQKYVLIGVVGLAVLTVFLLSSGTVNPSWNPFQQPPSGEVLENAIYNLSKIEKMSINGTANMKIINEGTQSYLQNPLDDTQEILSPKKIEVALVFNQLVDYSIKENKKNSTDFNLSLGIEGMELSMGAKVIGVDKSLFLNISSLPPYLPLGFDVETVKNQWLLVDPVKLGLSGGEDVLNNEQDVENFNEAFLSDIKNLVTGKNIFKIKKDLGTETIDNENAIHYFVELNKNTFRELFPEFINILMARLPESQKQTYQQNLQQTLFQFEQNFDAIWKQLGGVEFDVWINNDNILKKVKFAKKIADSSIDFEVVFSEFNKDFVIEAPTEYKPIEQVLPLDLLGLATSTLPISQ